MTDRSDREREILDLQLTMNEQTWAALLEHGLQAGDVLQLDLAFGAPGEAQAKALAAQLQADEGCSDASAVATGVFRKQWEVTAMTRPVAVSREFLDGWVAEMVAAGCRHECEFDGWGARVP